MAAWTASMSERLASVWGEMKKKKVSYLFMAPFLILYVWFTIIPIFQGMYLSFTYFNVLEPPRWIGLANFRSLFLEDEIFRIAIGNTLKFAFITGPVGYFASFFFAWLLHKMRFRLVYALAFYTPSVVGPGLGFMWKYIFSGDQYGLANNVLMRLGIIHEPILWTQDVDLIMPVVIFVACWMSLGTGFLAHLAGLQNVPHELYEAAAIDGVRNALEEVWYITLPMMRPQLLFAAVLSVVSSFSVFGVAADMVGFPSPLYAAHTVVAHLRDYAFIRFEMGYAAAISVVLLLTTFGLSRLFMRILSSKDM